jgi:hypothetical protein
MSPTRSSLITHSILSTNKEPGIEATIFLEPPKDPAFKMIQPNSVYLTTCKENQAFDEFIYSSQQAVVLTIPMYITLLQFFRAQWPDMKQKMEIEFSKICKQTAPIQLDPHIHFSLAATCHYKMMIEDAFLDFKKSSDSELPNRFHLLRENKWVWLNADTMQKLAEASVQTLVNTLYKAGYEDTNIHSDHE